MLSSAARQTYCYIPLLLLFFNTSSIFTSASPSSSSPSSLLVPLTTPASSITMADNNGNGSTTATEEEPMMAVSSSSSSSTMTYKHVVFSDIDGTLVHYPIHLQKKSATDDNDDKDDNDDNDGELIYFPPSKTGTRGVISKCTLQLCHRLRHGNYSSNDDNNEQQRRINGGGVPFVLISGMRTTTLFQRLPYLPRADAYVSESGGRIFYPTRPISSMKEHLDNGVEDNTQDGLVKGLIVRPISYSGIMPSDEAPFSLVEDMHWRDRISDSNAAGSDGYDDSELLCPMEKRRGKLWDFGRTLAEKGYVLDTSGYATAYRINRKHQNAKLAGTFDEFLARCAERVDIPEGLGCSTNLGCADVYPIMSGKKNCAAYVLRRFLHHGVEKNGDEYHNENGEKDGGNNVGGASNDDDDVVDGERRSMISLETHATCMCDDDNDVEMAMACRKAYLPSVGSESVRNLVESQKTSKAKSSTTIKGGSSQGTLMVTEDVMKGIVGSLATEAALEAIISELK